MLSYIKKAFVVQEDRIIEVEAKIEKLTALVEKLVALINKNSGNSSPPPVI